MPAPAASPSCPCPGTSLSEAASLLQALANEYRLMIVTSLFTQREMSAADLAAFLGVRRTVLNRHITMLRQCGILAETRRRNSVYFRLDDNKVAPLASALGLT